MSINAILTGLNQQQKEAVTTTEGYVRVVAGAGSGKTKALISRYSYIVKALGIDSSNVLCVTFTNKASEEMRKRVRAMLGPGIGAGLITTYHGFCVRVLREDISYLKYPKRFIILDEEDQKMILREIYEELGLTITYNTFNNMLEAIRGYKLNGEYVRLITGTNEMVAPNKENKQSLIIHKYLEKQKRVYGLDFDDLINFTFVLFEDFPEVLRKWQEKIHYVQVDEFQDSSIRQIELVDMISKKHGNLFVVGDPDQTIYEWRGARPEYFVNFDKKYPSCKTIILNQNYRSTPEILELGNSMIKNNKLRIDKDLFTHNSPGMKVLHYHGKTEEEEVNWIADRIETLVKKQNVNLNDVAILYRANYLSRFIEQTLIQRGINYVIYGGFKFFQRREIKDSLAYLRMITASDDLSFLRVINTPRRSVGKKRITFIKNKAEEEGLSYYDVLKKYINDSIFNRTESKEFLEVIEEYKSKYKNMSVSMLLKELLDKTGYDQFLREDGDQDRIDNVSELFNSIVTYEQSAGEDVNLEEYLQDITLYTDLDQTNEKDSVKLMTIHTAKGLEFPYVFLINFNEGVLPNYRALEKGKVRGLEEERRLAYVAITRAEKEFYMTESEGFNNRGRKYPSRFILEIKEHLFDRLGEIESDLIEESLEYIKGSEESLQSNIYETKFKVGQSVKHPIFKDGEVIDIDEDNRVYKVKFSSGIKPIRFDFKDLIET